MHSYSLAFHFAHEQMANSRLLVVVDLSNNEAYVAPQSNCGSKIVSIEKNTPISSVMGICPQGKAIASGGSTGSAVPTVTSSASDLTMSCFASLVVLAVFFLVF